ncbi:ABC transporter ATP-binding protein [Jeotgalibacillus proteolyticus]|uniref:ABC transporter ATP-binding protein n=1 Tax=Jeotgalibacillus proteolyticus TaxID=2082395 RepID=UPI003CE7ECB1
MAKLPNEPIIEFKNITYRHAEELAPVLSHLSFSIFKGDTLLLAGPSGAGKSTITMLMNGILPSNGSGVLEGEIDWFGTSSEKWKNGEISKRIGVMFQDPESQFCMTTVEEEIAFGLENLHLPRKEMRERIHDSLSQTGLEGFEKRTIQRLSGGQKQRVALACLLAMRTEVLLLDEPFANIDPLSRKELIETLAQLKEKLSLTLIIIDHDLNGWTDWINRVLLLDESGTIGLDMPLEEALSAHLSSFEALTVSLPLHITLQKGNNQLYVLKDQWVKQLSISERSQLGDLLNTGHPKKEFGSALMELRNSSFRAGNQAILEKINFTLLEGETIAFCGHNGAGKSTLALLLAGLYSPTSGDLLLNGKSVRTYSLQEMRRRIGYVFQNPEHQFVEHTVEDDLGFGLKIQKLPAQQIQERTLDILKAIRLDGFQDRHPLSLSQGQKRRLSVASMTIDDQDILVLDEPTYGQDAGSLKNLTNMLLERKKQGKTTVLVTHDMELIQSICDRTLLLSKGRVQFEGPPEQLWGLGEDILNQHGLTLPPSVALRQALGGYKYVASYH